MFWIAAPFTLGFVLARALPDRTGRRSASATRAGGLAG
jgi:hypothetical protein